MKPHEQMKARNPYLFNLSSSLQKHFTIVNYNRPQKNSLSDLIRFFFQTDIFYFNWIENVASMPGFIFLSIFLKMAKAFNKKVVWTHHNIHPHSANSNMGDKLIRLFASESDYVVTHTRLSAGLLKMNSSDSRLAYFFHPFFSQPRESAINTFKKYDLLIWGNMRKSKGIDDFMEYLSQNSLLDKYRIKIIGKFESENYFEEFQSLYRGAYIEFENRYADTEELKTLHQQSKFVFFPYTGSSVLNSGALITSLPYGATIIGPRNGAFTEIGKAGLIHLYSDFKEVAEYIDNFSEDNTTDLSLLKQYCSAHTWDKFSEFINNKVSV